MPSAYLNTESFILTEGILAMASEVLSRTLHPSRVLEAESWTDTNFRPIVENNNGGPNETPRFNGGRSVVKTERDNWLEYTFSPPLLLDKDYEYSILIRVANPRSESVRIELRTDARYRTGTWHSVVEVPPTGHKHEYVVIEAPTRASLSPQTHSVRVTFLGDGLSLDAIVVRNRGTKVEDGRSLL